MTGRRARRSGRRFLVVRPLRTHGEPNGPADTGFARKTRPRCAWAEARPPAAPAHPVWLFSTARTRLGRGSLGQHGGAGQTASGPAGEGLDGLAGLAPEGLPAGVAGATKNKLRRRRMGVISPPRFFSPRGGCSRHSERRADGKSISMIPASLSSCYAGRGGKNKTEGLQYLEPKGNVLLCSPGELFTLRRQAARLCCALGAPLASMNLF